ncbi:MAG: tRNA wybutosine-synthesizing 3 family protein [Candidatus Pacearchaeota archaeon]
MSWEKIKKNQLRKKDNSSIGKIDKKIKKLCEKINKQENYYTTSSCSGRIVLIKKEEKKKPNLFLFRKHEEIDYNYFVKVLDELKNKKIKGIIYFKQEPCVLAVACKTLEDAKNLINKAKFCGWKNSGMIAGKKRFICELRSTEKIELPIIGNGEILFSEKYLKILIKEANEKLKKTWEKINKLERLF